VQKVGGQLVDWRLSNGWLSVLMKGYQGRNIILIYEYTSGLRMAIGVGDGVMLA
jgi:hypothetical protein